MTADATYHVTVYAYTEQDAPDLARRIAETDGWTALKDPKPEVHAVGVHVEGKQNRWAVKMWVQRA
jgi:hypothetical protein